jgi:hypothetical protein
MTSTVQKCGKSDVRTRSASIWVADGTRTRAHEMTDTGAPGPGFTVCGFAPLLR